MNQIVKLLQSIIWSYDATISVFFLFLLMIFLFAIIGCYVFAEVHYDDYKEHFSTTTELYNFDEFYKAFALIFLTSNDSYEVFMFEYMSTRKTKFEIFLTVAFFISYFFFCFILMLNLFLLIIIMQYDDFYKKKENPLEKFEKIANVFKELWSQNIEENDNLMSIKSVKLKNFLELFETYSDKKNFPKGKAPKDDLILPKHELDVRNDKLYIFDLRLLE